MVSKWFRLKDRAITLRRKGKSLRQVESILGIPRSTLSGWFKDIQLDQNTKNRLHENWLQALVTARKKAVQWHNNEKEKRIMDARKEAEIIMGNLNFPDKSVTELALAMLYLGEGFKSKSVTGIGNTNPLILKFFLHTMTTLYKVDMSQISCSLHLRADQNPKKLTIYWSKVLKIPLSNFGKASIDKRTEGSETYKEYRGVCVIRCGNVAIQRKLLYLSKVYCEKILETMGG